MGTIISFPTPEERTIRFAEKRSNKSRQELLTTISNVAWENIDAYLEIENVCMAPKMSKVVTPAIRNKLYDLELINKEGYPYLEVQAIIRSIAARSLKQRYCY